MSVPPPAIPPALARRMRTVHGAAGAAWVEAAPGRIAALAEQWRFTPHEPLANLTYAFVVPVTLDSGEEAVLKAQPPHMESRSELAALPAWQGKGAVRLLRADADGGFALLERLRPGTLLTGVPDDDESIRIAAALMPTLWREPPADAAIITTTRWGEGFTAYLDRYPAGDGPVSGELVDRAAAVWRHLDSTTGEPRLLHGDFHHDNILAATREPWLAIDPKGLAGDPALEPAMLLLNPRPRVRAIADLAPFFSRRLDVVVAESGLDRDRVAGWAFAKSVLGLTWDAGEGGDDDAVAEGVRQSRALASLLPLRLQSLPST